jgi:RHS repeat-associated protein
VETRDGSGNLVSQFVRGLRYIDEVVMVRVKDEGELYVHQDANWNVVGLTDLGGRLVERYVYRPYGEVIVHQLGGYADYDGDGDVDANDRGEITGLTCGGASPTGACRVLDLDFDNDCDSSDETVFDALPHTGTVVHPARRSSLLGQPFAHQGLLLDPEIGSYQNRFRQYGPGLRRFVQRDPIASVFENPILSPEVGTRVKELLSDWPKNAGAVRLAAQGLPSVGSLQQYVYVDGRPTVAQDPLGLYNCTSCSTCTSSSYCDGKAPGDVCDMPGKQAGVCVQVGCSTSRPCCACHTGKGCGGDLRP